MKLQNKLKIVAISDLHGILPQITEPADIMLIAGDIVPLNIQFNKSESKKWFEETFAEWIQKLPVDKVYMVAGNHDAWFEGISSPQLNSFIKACHYKVTYLKNETVSHLLDDGTEIKIFGTPYCKIFGSWPFMRLDSYLTEKFKEIPNDCDIIISHDPPFNISLADCILGRPYEKGKPPHVGNIVLADRLKDINYKLLVCGHIHSGDHNLTNNIVNVSIVDENYELNYSPFYTELTFEKKISKENLKYQFIDGIMTKELFVETMDVIQKKSEYDNQCNKALGEIFDDGGGFLKDYFVINHLISILNHMFYPNYNKSTFSDIEYFIYDLNFGKGWTETSITEKGTSIDISTADKLYDYLIKNLK